MQDLVKKLTSNKYARPAMFILPVVIAAGLMKPYFMQSMQTSSLDLLSNTETIDNAVQPNKVVAVIDQHLEEKNNQRSQLTYTEPEYCIIVGSFKDQANAVQFMNRPVFGKVDAELLFTNNLYRVSVGSFKSKDVATKRLIELRVRNRELKDAWVFTKK